MQDPFMTNIQMPQATVRLNHPMCFCGMVATSIYPTAEPIPVTTPNISAASSTNSRSQSSPSSSPQSLRHKSGHGYGSGYSQITPSLVSATWISSSSKQRISSTTKARNSNNNTNWVYECHYTPIQKNPCRPVGNQIEQWQESDMNFELLRIAQVKVWDEVAARAARSRTSTPSQDLSSGTIESFFDPRNTHSRNEPHHSLAQEPSSPMESSSSSSSSSPLSSSSLLSLPLSLSTAKGGNRDKGGHEDLYDDLVIESKSSDHNAKSKFSSRSPPLSDQATLKDYGLYEDNRTIKLDDSFFATASRTTPRHRDNIHSTAIKSPTSTVTRTATPAYNKHNYLLMDLINAADTATSSGSQASTLSHAATSPTTVGQELASTPHELSAAVSFLKPSPHMTRIPDVKVCGFHMHALEWHTMQNLGTQEQITLTERAQCPIFNLSVTRWLKKGANNLQKKPFNSIKCHCGDPMVVAPDVTPADQGGYDLVCPKTLSAFNDLNDKDNTLRRQRYGSAKDHTKSSSGNEQSKPQDSQRPCSKVIKMCEVMYPPLLEPVHAFIPNDEWLDRCFSSRPTRRSYYLPNHGSQRKNRKQPRSSLIHTMTYYPMDYSKFRRPQSRQRKPRSVSFNFKPDIITGCVSPRSTSPSRRHGAKDDSSEWPIPDWVEQSMTISNAILDSDKNSFINLWGGENVSDLDKWRVFELDEDVLSHSIKEALKDAKEYSDQHMKKVKTRLEEHRKKENDIDVQLQKLNLERAKMAQEIKEMDKNSLEMTHKCRVCYERVLTHAVLPCYHLVMCGSCASIVNECIVCRVRKTGLQRIRWG